MIVTFYSFKGGVGRSMALANTAELLYQRGVDVLVIDFDLEAPGLDRFFETPESATSHSQMLRSRGVVDLILSYKTLRSFGSPRGAEPEGEVVTAPADGVAKAAAPAVLLAEPIANFIVPIYPKSESRRGSLFMMPAGRRDEEEYGRYADRVSSLDLADLYTNWGGQAFFDWFVEQLNGFASVVLIDSRTGITEMSGVCTHHLADSVALLLAPNEQNIDGINRIVRSLEKPALITEGRGGRPLSLMVVPSRVESSEGDKLDAFAKRFEEELRPHIDSRLEFANTAFVDLRIPYVPHYAYVETVAMREAHSPKAADLVAAYGRLAAALVELSNPDGPLYLAYHAPPTTESTAFLVDFPSAPSDFSGRQWLLDAVSSWMQRSAPQVFLITGPPGSGKTAVASRLLELHGRETRAAPRIVFAFSCAGRFGEGMSFVTGLAHALAAAYPTFLQCLIQAAGSDSQITLRAQQRIGSADRSAAKPAASLQSIDFGHLDKFAAFAAAIARPLQLMVQAGFAQQIVILVDALDAAQSADADLPSLLARALRDGLPRQVRLLVTSRRSSHPVTADAETVDLVANTPQAEADLVAYAASKFSTFPRSDREPLAQAVATASGGNFLVAKLAVSRLLASRSNDGDTWLQLDSALGGEAIAQDMSSYFGQILSPLTLNHDRWSDRHRPLLGALAVAREPLTAAQLAGIVDRPRSEVADDLRSIADFLLANPGDGSYALFHVALADYLLRAPELGIDAGEQHARIARYFWAEYAPAWGECRDPYPLRHSLGHLLSAFDLTEERRLKRPLADEIVGLLFSLDFLEARIALLGLDPVLGEMEKIRLQGDLPDVSADLERLIGLVRAEAASAGSPKAPDDLAAFAERVLAAARRSGLERLSVSPSREARMQQKGALAAEVGEFALSQAPKPGPDRWLPAAESALAPVSGELIFSSPSMRVAWTIWRQARVSGRFWLMLAGLLCLGVVGLSLVSPAETLSYALRGVARALFVLLLATTLWSLWVLRFGKRSLGDEFPPEMFDALQSAGSTTRWINDYLAFRDGRCYRVMGSLYVASPYFETATILFFATTIIIPVMNPALIFQLLNH